MADKILDTSVLIAFAMGEPHDVNVDEMLAGAAISAVTLAEFTSVLHKNQMNEEDIAGTLHDFNLTVLPVTEQQGLIAGRLIPLARPLNIGLGDCMCIAASIAQGLPVWTADRDWAKLQADADIRLIRGA